jgi:predicted DNA-binding transcriptional regulator YafY
MPQAERRYDRLAVRLSLIISRLVAGETLNMQKLAPSLVCRSAPFTGIFVSG